MRFVPAQDCQYLAVHNSYSFSHLVLSLFLSISVMSVYNRCHALFFPDHDQLVGSFYIFVFDLSGSLISTSCLIFHCHWMVWSIPVNKRVTIFLLSDEEMETRTGFFSAMSVVKNNRSVLYSITRY